MTKPDKIKEKSNKIVMMCLDTSGSMSKKYEGTEGNLEFH
jgi:uncharacterized sporulation protein YeaH/YhbH (DUF444 family)